MNTKDLSIYHDILSETREQMEAWEKNLEFLIRDVFYYCYPELLGLSINL